MLLVIMLGIICKTIHGGRHVELSPQTIAYIIGFPALDLIPLKILVHIFISVLIGKGLLKEIFFDLKR